MKTGKTAKDIFAPTSSVPPRNATPVTINPISDPFTKNDTKTQIPDNYGTDKPVLIAPKPTKPALLQSQSLKPSSAIAAKSALEPPRSGAGRPPQHQEPWSKVTVVLLNRHIAFLDEAAAKTRGATGAVVSRSAIIQAMIELSEEVGCDLSTAGSEDDIKEIMRAALHHSQ